MKQTKAHTEHQVKTPIGILDFSVCTKQGKIKMLSISSCSVTPQLPEKMSVEKCVAVVLRCTPLTELKEFKFSCAWLNFNQKGYGASGEGLEAWEWEASKIIVMVGTEDNEWASQRIGMEKIAPDDYLVSMNNNQITIEIALYMTKNQHVADIPLVTAFGGAWHSKEINCFIIFFDWATPLNSSERRQSNPYLKMLCASR